MKKTGVALSAVIAALLTEPVRSMPQAAPARTPQATSSAGPYGGSGICRFAGFLAYPQDVTDAILKFAAVTSRDVVYDIGWGDGSLLNAAARMGARGVGIPLCPRGMSEAVRNAQSAGVTARVKFVDRDFLDTDMRDATVVVLHLLPTYNQKLFPKLTRELKPGARIVSANSDGGSCYPPDRTLKLTGKAPRTPGGSAVGEGFTALHSWTIPIKDNCSRNTTARGGVAFH